MELIRRSNKRCRRWKKDQIEQGKEIEQAEIADELFSSRSSRGRAEILSDLRLMRKHELSILLSSRSQL